MSSAVTVLETITLTAPFGVRFWDVAMVAPAEGGLSVVGYPDAFPELRIFGQENHSGVFCFSGLPGLRNAENGSGDDDFWNENPPAIPYTFECSDPQNRYLPYRFTARLPVRGLFGLWESPVSGNLTPDATWLPAFSSPSRPMPVPMGVIHAQLQDDTSGEAAAWALLTVQAPGLPKVTGLSDENGAATLAQPYPEPTDAGPGSPLRAPNLTEQAWQVEIAAYYSARAHEDAPYLDEILQQGEAVAWRDTSHTAPADEFTLLYGQELILRSVDSTSGREMPVLLVTPAASPL